MAYEKHNYQSGAVLMASELNEMDDAIEALDQETTQLKDDIIQTAGIVEEMECELTDEVKTALLACFTRVAWIGDDGQTYYDALSDALNRSRVISSISAVFTQGSATIYDTDELYALKQYLTVTVTYSDGTTKEVNNYTLSGNLVAGTSTITVAYNKKTTTFNVTVTHQEKTLESISATFNSSASITTDNVLDDLRPYLTVRASYSDGSTDTITNYTLSGSLNVGANTITVTYNNKTATFTVNVTQAEKTLQSITATFTQGSAVIYTDSSLDDLKPYLTVTANYSDGTTQTITGYTLSGTLTAGTSTITASYGGKTATFNVTVTERVTPTVLYSLPSPTTFNGTDTYVDTNIKLMTDTKSTFTFVFDLLDTTITDTSTNKQLLIFHDMYESNPWPGMALQARNMVSSGSNKKVYSIDVGGTSSSIRLTVPNGTTTRTSNDQHRLKGVCVIDVDNLIARWYATLDGTDYNAVNNIPQSIVDVNINYSSLIGCRRLSDDTKDRFWKGTMYDFKVYNYAWTESEAQAYLQEDHS